MRRGSGGTRMRRIPGMGSESVGMRTFAYTFAPAAFALTGVLLARSVGGIPIEDLTTEPTTIAGLPPYAGVVSTLGCFGWSAAVGMFLLGACLLVEQRHRHEAAFLVCSAIFSAYIGLDDAFTFHEAVLPAIGIPESLTYAAIGIAVVVYAASFRHHIRRSAWLFLLVAVALLGSSVLLDKASELLMISRAQGLQMFVEDGVKLFGICSWVAYAALTTRGLLRCRHSPMTPLLSGLAGEQHRPGRR